MASSRRPRSQAGGNGVDTDAADSDYVSWRRAALVEGSTAGARPWSSSRVAATTALPILAFLALATWWGVDRIESDVEQAARSMLETRGIDTSTLTFAGDYRNVTVDGTLPEGVVSGDIERILEEERGPDDEDIREALIRAVRPEPQLGAVNVTVTSDGATLLLTGNVPADDHRSTLLRAAEATGLDVIDNLTVSGLTPSSDDAGGQIRAMAAIVQRLDSDVESADISVDDSGPVIGTVRARDGLAEQDLRDAGPELAVSSPDPLGNLDVLVTFDGDRIVLDGEVLTEAQAARLRSAAVTAVGEDGLVDNLTVLGLGAAIEGADAKVDAAASLVAAFSNAQAGDVVLDDTDLTMNVEVTSEAFAGQLRATLQSAAGVGLRPGGEVTVSEPVLSLEEEILALQAELDALQDEIRENVVFNRSSNSLAETAPPTLDKVIDAMDRYQRPVVEVGGHTDSRGTSSYNRELSERRADAVVDYLIAGGMDPNRLNGVGYGEDDPVSPEETDEAYRLNRRVEFTALEKFE